MTKEEIEQAIASGINSAIDVKAKDFFIGREEHYQHHQFIKELVELMKTSKKTAMRVFVSAIVLGTIGLLIFGFWKKLGSLING